MKYWKYKKSNNTLNFKSDEYTYEIDLDRELADEWLKHLAESKCNRIIPIKSLYELANLYETLGHKVDMNALEKWIEIYRANDKSHLESKSGPLFQIMEAKDFPWDDLDDMPSVK